MKIFLTLLLGFLTLLPIPAEVIRVIGPDYTIDLPEGWHSVNTYNSQSDSWDVSFANSFNSAFLNIVTFPANRFKSSTDMCKYVKKNLKATGDYAGFTFSGMDATLADFKFKTKKREERGYFIFINGKDYDYALLTFTDIRIYKKNKDEILSAIDSFAPKSDSARLFPGPIGQFFYPIKTSSNGPYGETTTNDNGTESKKLLVKTIKIGDKRYAVPFDSEEVSATQVLVEREARILTHYRGGTPLAIKAWKRFYRMIYRENYHRLDKLYNTTIAKEISDETGKAKTKTITDVLKWIQNFTYSRTNTISDLLSPLATAFNQSGDCDSRSLLFIILTHHMGIDSILLISSKYSHSAVGLGINARGATIKFKNKPYIYTETTDKVNIGMVPKKMADPSGWIGVKLSFSKYSK